MPGLEYAGFPLAAVLVVYIVCRTQVRMKLNEYENDAKSTPKMDNMLSKLDFNLFKENYYQDHLGLNTRLERLERLDGDYKKKVDALVAKAGFGL